MTGISELTSVQVVTASPARIRVSILGGQTQLDVALPLDVPVSDFVPDLARLVSSRTAERDDNPANDERRTFWVLSRFDTGKVLSANKTLREASITNGELLKLSSERALSPPALYDDVVDAAARLNKAAYAAWDSTAARWMAFAGIQLAALTVVFLLVGDVGASFRIAKIAVAAAIAIGLVGAASVAWRSQGLNEVANCLGWAAIPITAAVGWALLARFGPYGIAAACAMTFVLNVVYYRVISTGHWGYVASSVPALFGALAMLSRAAGLRLDVACVAVAIAAAFLALTVSRLTVRLGRFEVPTIDAKVDRDEWAFENPFVAPATSKAEREADSGAAMPTAEAVWTHVRSAELTRSALLTGLGAVVATACLVLLRSHTVGWRAFTFAIACAAVIGLHSRVPDVGFERAALAIPAALLVATTCVAAQNGRWPIPLTAFGLLLVVAVVAVVVGARGWSPGVNRWATLLSYLEYAAVGSLIPLALWVTGVYERVAHW